MKRITQHLSCLAVHTLLISMGIMLLSSCSSDSEETNASDEGPKLRRLTIRQVDDDATRATLKDAGKTISPSWEKGEAVRWVNLSRANNDFLSDYTLTADDTNYKTSFTGNVTCNKGDYLSIIYPVMENGFNVTTDGHGYSYTISLSGQDGKLETLAKYYHYVYGLARIISTAPTTADAVMGKTKSLLTVCKFSFKDKNGNPINIDKLEISYPGFDGPSWYPQTAKVAFWKDDIIAKENVMAIAETSTTPLVINASQDREDKTVVYVALMPTYNSDNVAVNEPRTFKFVVNDTYSGTFSAKLKPGVFVKAENLELTSN